jgi:hypothetical protein
MNLYMLAWPLILLSAAFGESNQALRATASGQPSAFASLPVSLPTGDLNFAPAVTYNSGGIGTMSVVAADVNNDGIPDLVVANWCVFGKVCVSGSVGVLLGKGDGTFRAPVAYSSGGNNARSIAVADVNGDGNPDLIVVNVNSGDVGILLGEGNGTFQAAVTYNSGSSAPFSVAVADMNQDGQLDLVVANDNYNGDGSVSVLLGNGDGTFQNAVNYSSGGYEAWSVAVADVNGDGNPDVLVANFCSDITCTGPGSVGVLLGNGDGTLQTPYAYSSGAYDADSITVADINHDGYPDLLVANQCGNPRCGQEGTVGVLLGKGDGTFRPVVSYASGGYSNQAVAVADVNGDGIPDLLTANLCATACKETIGLPGSVGVLLGNGDGTFDAAVSFGTGGYGAFSVAAADLNGDGQPDLLVANCALGAKGCSSTSKGVIGVLINTSSPAGLLWEP